MEQAIQVSPVTESEMEQARNIFQRMVDNVVGASQVVNGLRTDTEFLRTRNRELDEMVQEVRRQRDVAYAELEASKLRVKELEGSLSYDNVTVEGLRKDCDSLNEQLITSKRQADDMAYANMELSDKLKAAKEWIEGVSRCFQSPPVL